MWLSPSARGGDRHYTQLLKDCKPSVHIHDYCLHEMHVYVITCSRSWVDLPRSLLTFRTLRVGFPDARVTVVDNGSSTANIPAVAEAAKTCGGDLVFVGDCDQPKPHWEVIDAILGAGLKAPLAFWGVNDEPRVVLDPDLIFWERVEHWQPSGVLAGRLVPKYFDTQCDRRVWTHARLHTSFLWAPVPMALRMAIFIAERGEGEWQPWRPVQVRIDGAWHRWDVAASLWSAIHELCSPFTDDQLDCYDHMFAGCHNKRGRKAPWHDRLDADGDLSPMKGVWREQQKWFEGQDGVVDAQEGAETRFKAAADALYGLPGAAFTRPTSCHAVSHGSGG